MDADKFNPDNKDKITGDPIKKLAGLIAADQTKSETDTRPDINPKELYASFNGFKNVTPAPTAATTAAPTAAPTSAPTTSSSSNIATAAVIGVSTLILLN